VAATLKKIGASEPGISTKQKDWRVPSRKKKGRKDIGNQKEKRENRRKFPGRGGAGVMEPGNRRKRGSLHQENTCKRPLPSGGFVREKKKCDLSQPHKGKRGKNWFSDVAQKPSREEGRIG